MKDRSKTFIKTIVTIALIVISVYYSIKGIKTQDLLGTLLKVNYLWVLLSIPIILAAHWLRAMRWKTMLRPIIKAKSVYNLFKAVMIGYAANNVTPRGGELLRPFIYARQENVSFTSTFGTIVVERFIDLLTLLLMFVASLLIFRHKIITALDSVFDKLNVDIQPANFLYIGVICLVVLIVSFYPPVISFLLRIIVKPISQKYYEKLHNLFDKFKHGFEIIKKPSLYFRLSLESVAIWICYGLPMYLIFFAFGFQSQLHLGFSDAYLLLIVSGVAVTIAPTPGAIGVHHVSIKVAMMYLYLLGEKEALAYAIITHGINYAVNTLVGGFYYIRNRQAIADIDKMEEGLEVEEGEK